MKQALFYSLKVWLTTILLTPLLRILIAWAFNLPTAQLSLSYFEYYELAILYGAIFSLPGAILLWIFTTMVNRRPLTIIHKKSGVSVVVFIETMLIFHFVFWLPKDIRDDVVMTIPYCVATTAAIWFYRLKPVPDQGG